MVLRRPLRWALGVLVLRCPPRWVLGVLVLRCPPRWVLGVLVLRRLLRWVLGVLALAVALAGLAVLALAVVLLRWVLGAAGRRAAGRRPGGSLADVPPPFWPSPCCRSGAPSLAVALAGRCCPGRSCRPAAEKGASREQINAHAPVAAEKNFFTPKG